MSKRYDSSPERKYYHKLYSRKWYQEHKNDPEFMEKRRAYRRKWYQERKKDQEFAEKRKEQKHKYYMAHKDESEDLEKADYKEPEDSSFNMTKEKWLELYGYPMGDTTGWEHWKGWGD